MSEKKDFHADHKEYPVNQAGILKEKEKKDFEHAVVEKLRTLGKKITKKETLELLAKIEATRSIDSLKAQLLGNKESHDEALELILSLYDTIRKGAKEGISELKIDLEKVLSPKILQRLEGSHFSNRFNLTKKLENSELGKNILLDVAGIGIGIIDSFFDLLHILYEFIKDFARIPKHVIADIQENRRSKPH